MDNSRYFDLLREDLYNIYEGEIVVSNGKHYSNSLGTVNFQLSPYPQIIMNTHESVSIKEDIEKLHLVHYAFQVEQDWVMNVNGYEARYLEEQPDSVDNLTVYMDSIMKPDTEVDEVVIFIMNCAHIGLTYIEEDEYILESGDWVINFEFRPDKNIETYYDLLRRNRGYEITHIGTISRKNKESFLPQDIKDIISNLEWYLSFCSAQSVVIPIRMGFTEGNKVWEYYAVKGMNLPHFKDTHGWVPCNGVDAFNKFFPKVVSKLNQELWKDVLDIVLNWYLEVKADGMFENRIIATQIALEQLAWAYLVNQEQILDKEAYKKLRASDILRLFCYELKIPRGFIKNYNEEMIKKYNDDGVFMIVDFRNNLVHPDKKSNSYNTDQDTKYLVYSQGLYFLERAITSLFGYEGEINY